MNCPECQGKAYSTDSRTETSRVGTKRTRAFRDDPFPHLAVTVCARRRRVCQECGHAFITWEIPEPILDRAEAIAEAVESLHLAVAASTASSGGAE